jgi:hypothetical protein
MRKALKQVKFELSRGKNYDSASPFGIRVMILGESHYGAKGAASSL